VLFKDSHQMLKRIRGMLIHVLGCRVEFQQQSTTTSLILSQLPNSVSVIVEKGVTLTTILRNLTLLDQMIVRAGRR